MGLNKQWSKIVERRRRRQSSGASSSKSDANVMPSSSSSLIVAPSQSVSSTLPAEPSRSICETSCNRLTTRRVSFPVASYSLKPSSPSLFTMKSDAESDTLSLSPRSFGKTSDFSAWFSRKINGILGERVENSSVVSILTRTLSKATGRKTKTSQNGERSRNCSFTIDISGSNYELKRKSWFHSESQLLDLFVPETCYHAEYRAIADKYGLIVDLDDDGNVSSYYRFLLSNWQKLSQE